MIGLIQLVNNAKVDVDGQTIGSISRGIVALIGMEKTDGEKQAQKLIEKMINYRIFPDRDGKTNLSLKSIEGGLLLVPQFTLVADTKNGTRPGFSKGMPAHEGKILFDYLVRYAKDHQHNVASGQFGANMQVSLCNDGPMTFILNEQ